jgi:hypothetical protein
MESFRGKNRLSEVLDRATREGPQKIRRRNEAFIVIRADQVLIGEASDVQGLVAQRAAL